MLIGGGCEAPLLRFAGFHEPYIMKQLGEIVTIKAGLSPSAFHKGTVPYIKVDDLNASTWLQIFAANSVLPNKQATLVSKGSVIFPKRGAAILTNKVRLLGMDAYMDTNMMALEVKDGNSALYLYLAIEHCGLYQIADTSTIPQINNKHIEPYEIILAPPFEQYAVGNLFRRLNRTIDFSDAKLTKLRHTKQSLLRKMFV